MGIRLTSSFIALLAVLSLALAFGVQARATTAPRDCGIEETASWSSGNHLEAVRPHECLARVRAHKHGLARVTRNK
jgi:hypothetical protein